MSRIARFIARMLIAYTGIFALGISLGMLVHYIINMVTSEERKREKKLEYALNKVWEWHKGGGQGAFPENEVRNALRRWLPF